MAEPIKIIRQKLDKGEKRNMINDETFLNIDFNSFIKIILL